jgi:hypothetical protein
MRRLIAFALLPLLSAPVYGTTFYTRSTGSDATPCTQAQNASTPRRTIAAGIACLAGGDTLMVGGGTYSEGPLPVPPSGSSASQRTQVRAMPGEQVIVVPARTASDSSTGVLSAEGDYILYAGINVDARFEMGTLIAMGKASGASEGIVLCNMNLQGAWGQGISGQAQNSAFVGLEIHNTGQYCHGHGDPYCPWKGYHHAVYLGGESDMGKRTNNVFDGVYIHDIPDGIGLQLYAGGVTVRNSRVTGIAVQNGIWFLGGGSSLVNTSVTNVGGEAIAGNYNTDDAADRSAASACEGGGAPPKRWLPAPFRLRVLAQP